MDGNCYTLEWSYDWHSLYKRSALVSMLRPLNSVQIHPILHQLPQRTQLPQEVHPLSHGLQNIINLLIRRKPPDPEPNTRVRALVAVTQRPQDVRGLERRARTSGARGECDIFQCHEEGLAFDIGEGDVDTAGVVAGGVAVERGVFHGEEGGGEFGGEGFDAFGVVLQICISQMLGWLEM